VPAPAPAPPNSTCEPVAKWVYDIAKQRSDAEHELVDIADYGRGWQRLA
jgi:hypothetical protein